MNIDQLTELFKWMTMINIGVYLFSVVLSLALKDVVAKIHGKLFGIPEDTVSVIVYGYFGLYKIAIIVFIIGPYVSLIYIS
jgi:hypothetical protein